MNPIYFNIYGTVKSTPFLLKPASALAGLGVKIIKMLVEMGGWGYRICFVLLAKVYRDPNCGRWR